MEKKFTYQPSETTAPFFSIWARLKEIERDWFDLINSPTGRLIEDEVGYGDVPGKMSNNFYEFSLTIYGFIGLLVKYDIENTLRQK